MPLGAYAIIRYLDSLDRVKFIDPTANLEVLRKAIEGIRDIVTTEGADRILFDSLSAELRGGLQISNTYPARLVSLEGTADRLYSILVAPLS